MGKIVQFANYINRIKKGETMCKRFLMDIRKKNNGINDMPARAQDVLKYFQVEDYDNGIPIVEILINFGFKIYESNLAPDGLSAYIAVDPKFEEIYKSNKITCVNVKDNIGHKRFALAHELAHYLFDFDESENLYYYNTYFPHKNEDIMEEKRANKFAANLLMPKEAFLHKFKEYEILHSKPDIVSALGQYFHVSPTAVLRRFNELNIAGYINNVEK